jgi:hypothetical protein
MAIPVFPPAKENELQAWSLNWSTLITAQPTSVGLSAAQATAYAALHATWSAAYALVITPAGNSKANVAAKNLAKENLLNGPGGAWELVDIVQAFPGTTDAMRVELGLRIPDVSPTAIGVPQQPPLLSILSTSGRTMTIRLRDKDNPDRRGKPKGVQGATVLYYVGENAPADPALWLFLLNDSRTKFPGDIPPVVPAGSKVWVTAFWFNNRKQSSPVASAESVRVDDGIGNETQPLAEAA